MVKELPCMFSLEAKTNDVPNHFNGFSRVRNLYITGHASGAITFWDVSTPAFIPILALKQQAILFLFACSFAIIFNQTVYSYV